MVLPRHHNHESAYVIACYRGGAALEPQANLMNEPCHTAFSCSYPEPWIKGKGAMVSLLWPLGCLALVQPCSDSFHT